MEEEKLEPGSFVFHELDVVVPVGVLFAAYFEHWAEGLGIDAVAHFDETFFHEDIRVLLLADEGHCADGHEGVRDAVVDHKIFDISGSLACLDLLLSFLLHCLEKHLAADFLCILFSFLEGLDGQDDFAHLLLINIIECGLHVVSVETGQICQVDFCSQDLLKIGVIEILVLTENFNLNEMGSVVIEVGKGLIEVELVGGDKSATLFWYE